MKMPITHIKKRNGTIVPLDPSKIRDAIWKAAAAVGGQDRSRAEELSEKVVLYLHQKIQEVQNNGAEGYIPSVEDVQDLVEKVLIDDGHAKTAKAFILYREKRKELREAKALLGVEDDLKMSIHALKILEERYLLKDDNGRVTETPGQLFKRVAKAVARADLLFGASQEDAEKTEKEFYELLAARDFLPNSPTLANAGTQNQQLIASYVLVVPDRLQDIFETLQEAVLIHKSGGGTGFSFSHVRPKHDAVDAKHSVAAGPVAFLKIFDAALNEVQQWGRRKGANMAILRVDHPDVLEFIESKASKQVLQNFNISVGITTNFMNAFLNDEECRLINPRDRSIVKNIKARPLFDLICLHAWKGGDPGIVFLERLNWPENNPMPTLGQIESTDPCGEQPMLAYESSPLGSINLANHIRAEQQDIDWEKLRGSVHKAAHFLDNIIEVNVFPLEKVREKTKANRRIGIGVMGWADTLLLLGLPYNSNEAVALAEKTMQFMNEEAKKASVALAVVRGVFPNFERSMYSTGSAEDRLRNAGRTAIAPTGTISILAGCSQGIEPLFAICSIRKTLHFEFLEVHPFFEGIARHEGWYSEELMRKIASSHSVQHISEVPEQWKRIFVTAMDLSAENHVRMQAAFQKHLTGAVSKTVNLPATATAEEVREAFLLAWKLGCKGISVYRDASREEQVLTVPVQRPIFAMQEEEREWREKNKGFVAQLVPEAAAQRMRGRIYTRTGDAGETSFFTGERVKKCDCRIEALGAVDELNSAIGLVNASVGNEETAQKEIKQILERLQHDLFTVGAELALLTGSGNGVKGPKISGQHVKDLEQMIDNVQEKLVEQKSFILPGGTQLSAWLHFARTVARRAEREIVGLCDKVNVSSELLKYMNRLSDLLYVLARYANKEIMKEQQPIYKYMG